MELEVGTVTEGRITGITKFGAFVALEGGKSGLVHISEVANVYVSDVHDHVQMGQTVKVRVLNIGDDGRINLSIKRAEPPPQRETVKREPRAAAGAAAGPKQADPPTGDKDFEDRLKRFMQESDSRIADNRIYADHKQKNRRR